MAIDDKLLSDFDMHIRNFEAAQEWANQLYYSDQFSTIFTRPIISLLVAGMAYITDNLKLMKAKYLVSRQ